jgi:hypothetical protein
MTPLRVGIVGGGLAGALLGWRLRLSDRNAAVEIAAGPACGRDATAASGGMVRGYEPAPEQRRLAIEALVELRASRLLRSWAGYTEIGSRYLQPTPVDPVALAELHQWLPGSAYACGQAYRQADRPPVYEVAERHAGYISPSDLRRAALDDFVRIGGRVVSGAVAGIHPEPDGTISWTIGDDRRRHDIVIVAAGPWTPRLLAAGALPAAGYRTKQIQYGVYHASGAPGRLTTIVDETTGLYGRPGPGGRMLFGVPSDRYGVEPDRLHPDGALERRAAELAVRAVPGLRLGPPAQVVVAADCYTSPPVLRLRLLSDDLPNLYTFTGGSGGAAKTSLAASRHAAHRLLELPVPA